MANHLENEHSPYLQQHANNPVDWYPWGEIAFQKATDENKPIFLSIGYSSCHWCHVMERESFENEAIAMILNTHFVSIKVDREERPDIDKHFQEVYQLMNNRPGGWPTSIFLTETLKPFYTATYLPPKEKYGLPAFGALLNLIAERYSQEKSLLIEKADEILSFLSPLKDKIQATKLDLSIMERFVDQASQLFDTKEGGFNTAPKFPQTSILSLLFDIYRIGGEKKALTMATHTLTSMAKGGLRDIVDGGFCRYSTDNSWLVPHFEKMGYDNGLLAQLYIHAYNTTQDGFYKTVAFEILDFLIEKMQSGSLFFAASDADTQGEEGKYFVYSYDEALECLSHTNIPKESQSVLIKLFGLTPQGNFEGKNIIRLNDPTNTQIPFYQEAIEALKTHRKTRVYPFVDTKILVSWNAMIIKALFMAGRIDSKYLDIAQSSLEALTQTMYLHGQLFHSTLIGKSPKIYAFLEDYAYLGEMLIEAHQSTLDEKYLILATRLANSAIERYYNNGLWRFSVGEFETKADIYDSSYPSAMAMVVSLLYSLASLVDPIYQKFVFKTLEIHSYSLMRQPISSPLMTKMVIRYLKEDVILKATQERLQLYIGKRDTIIYPYCYFKNDTNEGFMLCNAHSCFGHEALFDEAIKTLNKS